MNKLLGKKKAPEPPSAPPVPPAPFPHSTYPQMPKTPPQGFLDKKNSRWKKAKKPVEPEPEAPELTLPSSDDFRTSLLMPNLSARFSMLRDQDDPNSLMGKASDDSVLAPRRRSRMMDFSGYNSNNLNDIAEVQSVNSSIRPPFVQQDRQTSYGSEDGYGSENDSNTTGSVMSRSRPGEGNVLFGGRQKVYRIPTAGANSAKGPGKVVYEDDLGMSAFQRYRQKEREDRSNRPSEESSGFDFGLEHSELEEHDNNDAFTPNDSAKDLSHSPSLSSCDKNRSTTSSVARSEARSSFTNATSIASQSAVNAPSPLMMASPPQPATQQLHSAKNRRLYDQGLDQHMHEQQTSALTRLNSIQRQRTMSPPSKQSSPPGLKSVQSLGNIGERPPQPVFTSRNAQSPPNVPSSAPLTTFTSMRKPSLSNVNGTQSNPQSSSSNNTEHDELNALNEALEPGDRGKATAMGAFNKPRHQFDEQQYLERQHQLQRSQSKAGTNPRKEPSAFQQRMGRFEDTERERSNSDSSSRSRSGSLPKKYEPSKAYNMFQNAANQMPATSGAQQSEGFLSSQTFGGFNNEQNELSLGLGDNGWQPSALPSVSEHPAMRAQKSKASLAEEDEEQQPVLKPAASNRSLQTQIPAFSPPKESDPVDSPTLGAPAGPLNGMMQHLRSRSNVSSIYPADSVPMNENPPTLPDMPWTPKDLDLTGVSGRSTLASDPRGESTYTSSNPWDLDELENPFRQSERRSVSPIDDAQDMFLTNAPSNNGTVRDNHSEVSQESESATAPWQEGLRKQHARDASSATQLERDAFASELAARRTAIQENMKTLADRDNGSRNQSPSRTVASTFKTFGIPKSKSRESMKRDQAHDPMPPPMPSKLFGGSNNGSNVDLSNSAANTRPRGNSNARNGYNSSRDNSTARPPVPIVQTRNMQSSEWQPMRARGDSDSSLPEHRQMASARAQSNEQRSRSNSSATTGRSRTGAYRDDLEKAMIEGTGNSASGNPSPMRTREPTPRATPDVLPNGNGPPIMNYFESKPQQPMGRLAPNGTLPTTLSNTVYSPTGSSTRPTPSPFSPPMSPPSGTNTPLSSFSSPPPAGPQFRTGALRKKTISKSEISEPTLISSTSNVDTIDLPAGASLKNGMDDEVAPLNQKKRSKGRLFGRGRSESHGNNNNYAHTANGTRGTRSNSNNDSTPRFDKSDASAPGLPHYAYASDPVSPERMVRSPIGPNGQQASMDGGMF